MARAHHQWRQKSKWQQICAICGQVRRWNGEAWRYRKEGALVLERQPCRGDRSVEDRYAELRKLVEAWQARREDALLLPGESEPQALRDAANDLATWRPDAAFSSSVLPRHTDFDTNFRLYGRGSSGELLPR